ncbi:MAG TPA: AAA family ATPase [Ktedonobacteraceae bacterium]
MGLLERDHYLDQLSELLGAATTGQGRIVLISGEAGIGKTALVEQFVQQSCDAAKRLWGACEALFTPRPLGPLYDIATQVRGELATLMGRETNRSTLFSAFLEELQKSPLPTVVVFEDVHWADEATLDLIKFLGRRILHLPVLFLVTYRDTELSSAHPLRSVIGDLPGKAVARLRLAPLSEHAVTVLAQQADHCPDQIYAVTGGNPFFVTEVLASATPGVPLMVRDAVFARMARLSSDARALLELVSVVPSRTERWLLEEVLCSPQEALEECLSSGMLSLEHMTVAFRHELARQAVENMLSPLRQQTLHTQVLQALMSKHEDTSQAARLVHHALGAHDEALVARYAPLAAQQAAAQGAHREAAAQYATALLCAAQFSLERQAELLEGRAHECYLTSQMEEAVQARQSALRIWRDLGRVEQVGHTLSRLSRLNWFLGKSGAAKQQEIEAAQLLETLPPGTNLAMAYSNRAQLLMVAETTEEAVYWGERAIELAEAAWLSGNLEQCLAEAQVGYSLALTHRDLWKSGELSAWMWRAGGLIQTPKRIAQPFACQIAGDWQEAAALWEQMGCPYDQALALAAGDAPAQLEALALFEQLGARPAVAIMKRRLRRQGIVGIPRGARLATRANQAGLTNRQLEVLHLMTEGLSNAEIASRLFTSLKTIEHHVSAVLAKLGVHSRAQAIRVTIS